MLLSILHACPLSLPPLLLATFPLPPPPLESPIDMELSLYSWIGSQAGQLEWIKKTDKVLNNKYFHRIWSLLLHEYCKSKTYTMGANWW